MFLFALALAAQATPVPSTQALQFGPSVSEPGFSRAPTLPGQLSAFECNARPTRARDEAIVRGEPLNRMPPALLQHTVIRLVDGCPVSTRVVQSRPAR
jgi:hypothetical protein